LEFVNFKNDIAGIFNDSLRSINGKKIIRTIIVNKDKISLYKKENIQAFFDKKFSNLIKDYK
jgi:hypothetical protein